MVFLNIYYIHPGSNQILGICVLIVTRHQNSILVLDQVRPFTIFKVAGPDLGHIGKLSNSAIF